jgi:PAS domain S-box-containing protein
MLGPWLVSITALGYLGLLFAIAFCGDRRATQWRSGVKEPVIYALSLAIYCTSWTFYGSVGRAASNGLDFVLIYLGPVLMMSLGYPLMRKILRIARGNNITSIADFIGARYGKSQTVAALATVIAVVGVLPYIALQLQAVTLSFDALVSLPKGAAAEPHSQAFWRDTALYVALTMAAFSILFGVRHVHASERHHGLIMAIAFESLVKLGAFLAVGIFVTFGMFSGPHELAHQLAADSRGMTTLDSANFQPAWISITLVAAFAFVCLPRQFHVAVVESGRSANLRMAAWLFPLYLVAINLFVPAIAAAGLLSFNGGAVPDLFVLLLPMSAHQSLLSLAVFIGGLSASTSMVIVESVALSTMICNELVVPALLRCLASRATDGAAMGGLILAIRRAAIFVVLLAGYGYHAAIGDRYPLASIGLISFCAVAQFAPALIAGLYWRGAHRHGALAGMAGGASVWAYALLLPSLSEAGWFSPAGLLGTGALPAVLTGLDRLTNGVLWSLLINTTLLVSVSLVVRHRERDRQQANVFVAGEEPIDRLDARSLGHAAAFQDLKTLAARFLGSERAERAFAGPVVAYRDKDLAAFAERLLSGAIGAASARIMVAATLRRRGASAGNTGAILDEASEAILFNRDLLRATLENISQGIGMFDPALRLAAWNRRLLELLGVPEHLAQIGTSLEHIVESCQRATTDTSVDLSMLLPRQNHAELYTQAHSYERRRGDGRVLELQSNPMPGGGFVLVCTDITEPVQTLEALRDRERRIRVCTDNVPALITYVDRDERYRFTNEPYDEALGQQGVGAIGRTIREVLGEERYSRLKRHIDAALSGQRRTFEIDFPHSGIEIARGTYIPHFDSGGHVIGFFTLYQDITEQRHAERVLREANEMLERRVAERTRELTLLNEQLARAKSAADAANVSKTRFLAAASHDLLQPLHAARLFIGALAERSRGKKTTALVYQVDEALEAVDELLQALLEISKLDAGALRASPRAVIIGEALWSVAKSFEPMARQRGLRLRVVDSRAVVITDPALLRRILQNFLSNAIRYTRRGSVLIGCRRRGDRVSVEVWDTGPGIPSDQLAAIFEEFKRLGGNDPETPAGLGLGLAIVDRIAKMLGHPIAVRSRVDHGSVFSVAMPVGPALAPVSVPHQERRVPNSLEGKVVLCVDNEPSVLSAMRTLLEGWSCQVFTASDLTSARNETRKSAAPPDLILMDYHLEGTENGLCVLDALAEDIGKRVPSIIITANYTETLRAAAQAHGYSLLNKPLKPAALRALMAQLAAQGEDVLATADGG